jgi:hypothetical protein
MVSRGSWRLKPDRDMKLLQLLTPLQTAAAAAVPGRKPAVGRPQQTMYIESSSIICKNLAPYFLVSWLPIWSDSALSWLRIRPLHSNLSWLRMSRGPSSTFHTFQSELVPTWAVAHSLHSIHSNLSWFPHEPWPVLYIPYIPIWADSASDLYIPYIPIWSDSHMVWLPHWSDSHMVWGPLPTSTEFSKHLSVIEKKKTRTQSLR